MSGCAVIAIGDIVVCSAFGSWWCIMPPFGKAGYADLFSFDIPTLLSVDVSTLNAPGRAPIEKEFAGGITSTGVGAALGLPGEPWLRLAEIRASREVEPSLGSLFVLDERARPWPRLVGGGVPSAPGGAPLAGSSV